MNPDTQDTTDCQGEGPEAPSGCAEDSKEDAPGQTTESGHDIRAPVRVQAVSLDPTKGVKTEGVKSSAPHVVLAFVLVAVALVCIILGVLSKSVWLQTIGFFTLGLSVVSMFGSRLSEFNVGKNGVNAKFERPMAVAEKIVVYVWRGVVVVLQVVLVLIAVLVPLVIGGGVMALLLQAILGGP